MKKCICVLVFIFWGSLAADAFSGVLKLGRMAENGMTYTGKSLIKTAGGDIKEVPLYCPEPTTCPTEAEVCKEYPTPDSCRSNNDCPSTSIAKYCNTASRRCVQCMTNVQCGGDETCENGACKSSVVCKNPESCAADSDCPSNSTAKYCEKASKRCVQCLTSKQCGASESCENGTCKTLAYTEFENISCPAEYPDKNEVSGVVSCTCNPTSCSGGKICVDGSCKLDGACTKHSDCPNNMLCRMLSGTVGSSNFVGKCSPPSEFCGGNVKVSREGDQNVACGACATSGDCPDGSYCYQEASAAREICPTGKDAYCSCNTYSGIKWSYEPQAVVKNTKGFCSDLCTASYISGCGYPYCKITGDHTFEILRKE